MLADALRERAAARFSGLLRVEGTPGGIIHLTDGQIAGCETPGAPGLEVILLRSQRIAEEDWDAAFTAAAASGRPLPDQLVAQGLLGAGETEALLRTTLADAMFALTCGRVDGWTEEAAELSEATGEPLNPPDCLLPLIPPARPGWLLGEATRRAQVLALYSGPILAGRDRLAIAPGTTLADPGLGPGQDEILALADGRRSARDIAFALGRGLYETLLQLSRMRAANRVVLISYEGRAVSAWPAHPLSAYAEDDQTANGLPRRRKDRVSAPPAPVRRSFADNIRLLLPRSDGHPLPGGGQ